MRKLVPGTAILPAFILLIHLQVQQCVDPALSATEEISGRIQDSILYSDSLSESSSTVERTQGSITEQVSVESTENSASEVQTNQPHHRTDHVSPASQGQLSETQATRSKHDSVTASVSPSLSTESLLSEEQSESISLSDSHHKLSDSEKISSSVPDQESISSSSSIVISVPSISSSMSSISSSSILPSASTTSAPEEIVTTIPLADEDLTLYETVSLDDHGGHDFRNTQPKTVEISPSKTSSVMEMTEPSYVRANPNRVGLLDGVIEEEDDHFLSHRAPQVAGGPLNQARSSVDGLASTEKTLMKKSNRRADPGPDISDILSGLLNVVGEGLSIATNYVQETNKKKAQEKVSTVDTVDVKPVPVIGPTEEKKKNNSRINNRGPPLLSPIPFEAIPLEILQNQRPGARPGVAIPQRPFQTHLPPGISGPPPTVSSPEGPAGGSGLKGVPLPAQLVPTQALPTVDSPAEGESVAGLQPGLPTRPGYSPDFSLSQDDDETLTTNNKKPSKNKIKTNKNKITKQPPIPEIKPVSTDPFIDLLLNEIKEGKLTTFPSSTSTTTRPPVELEPSFTPPLLVTPPSTPRVRSRPPNRRPWPGGRPPRPKDPPPYVKKYPDWKYQVRPQSSYPTPPLSSSKVNKRPFVFPTSRYPAREPAVVTGVAIPADNDVFDLTVTAQQNFGGVRKTKNRYQEFDGIITAARPGDQFVSIDGKRTYFDIGPTQAPQTPSPTPAGKGSVLGATLQLGGQEVFQPTKSTKYGQIVGSPLPVEEVDIDRVVQPRPYVPIAKRRPTTTTSSRPVKVPTATRLPPAPPVRIDTCIVGNDNTCGEFQVCKTYLGVSSCFCKPGYGRKNHRMLCKKTVRLLMSMKIDRIKDSRITWSQMYNDQNTEQYQTLSDEVNYAIGSAMSLTSFSNIYMGTKVNKFFSLNGAVTVNTTLEMEENSYTKSEIVKRDIKNKLIEVIQARANNIGSGNLYVSGPFNPIPGVEDFNECSEPEYNDCGDYSVCVNQFGGFTCQCLEGYGDQYESDPSLAGRYCESCPAEFCSGRGQCSISRGERQCECTGNFYGDQCQIDGEVLAVAIGASVAAVIIIFLTLICLCMWSRRWKREQQKTDLSRNFPRSYMVGSLPAPNYMTKMSAWQPQPSPIYNVDSQSQLRWAHHLDANGQNIYAQPIVYSGVGPHIYGGDSIYMAPPEPPRSIYGTLPRKLGNVVHDTTESSIPISTHYATFRRERLGPKVSLKLMQMMKADKDSAQDTVSIMSGFTENSVSGVGGVKTRGALGETFYQQVAASTEIQKDEGTDGASESLQPEPSRRTLAVGGGRMGPLPSIPRPSTALGTRQAPPLIDSSESEDTEVGRGLGRPRSSNSIMASNMTLDEEFDTEYLRYGGTVGVRNPRLVAQMRGAAGGKQQQQHIQMNMMAARGW